MGALTPEERAAIEAAVAAGRVERVPTGASGVFVYPRWTGTRLAEVDPDTGAPLTATAARKRSSAWAHGAASRRGGRAKDPAVAARRERVRDLWRARRTVAEMAAALDVPLTTIWNDLHVLGLPAIRRHTGAKDPAVQARRARIAALAGTMTVREMAPLIWPDLEPARAEDKLRNDLKRMGISARPMGPARSGGRRADPAVAARRDRVAALIAEAPWRTSADLAAEIGVPVSRILEDKRVLSASGRL